MSRAFFALTMIGLGLMGLIHGDFTPIWTGVAKSFPAREVLIYLSALISLGCGIALFWPRTSVTAARVLLLAFVLWLLVFRLRYVIRAPTSAGAWWSFGDSAVMIAAAWVLSGDKGLRLARALFGLGLIPFGIAHFAFLQRTVSMVPPWMPGGQLAWAYITGGAFIAAGLAIIAGVYARLAAALAAVMLALFTLIVWVPVISASPKPSDWTEFVSSWVLSAAAWVVADSYRGQSRSSLRVSKSR